MDPILDHGEMQENAYTKNCVSYNTATVYVYSPSQLDFHVRND